VAFQFQGVCYPDSSSALSAMASAISGTVVDVAGAPYSIDVTVTESALVYTGTRLDAVGSFVKNVTVTLQDCQLLQAADALEYSWLVAGLWAAAYAWVALRRSV